MTAEADRNWRDWRLYVFGDPYMVWHDGPSYRRLLALYEEDADRVDTMLVAGVTARDSLAARAINRLEPEFRVPRALAVLIAADVAPQGEFALRRAQTLFGLSGDIEHFSTMLTILDGGDHWGVRIQAAIALGQVAATREAIDVLQRTVADDDYLVRYHSANALLTYAGAEPDISSHPLFDAIASPRTDVRATAAHRKAWVDAAAELAAAARAALA